MVNDTYDPDILLVKALAGELSQEEQNVWDDILKDSEEYQHKFRISNKIREATQNSLKPSRPVFRKSFVIWYKAAASVLLCIVLGILWYSVIASDESLKRNDLKQQLQQSKMQIVALQTEKKMLEKSQHDAQQQIIILNEDKKELQQQNQLLQQQAVNKVDSAQTMFIDLQKKSQEVARLFPEFRKRIQALEQMQKKQETLQNNRSPLDENAIQLEYKFLYELYLAVKEFRELEKSTQQPMNIVLDSELKFLEKPVTHKKSNQAKILPGKNQEIIWSIKLDQDLEAVLQGKLRFVSANSFQLQGNLNFVKDKKTIVTKTLQFFLEPNTKHSYPIHIRNEPAVIEFHLQIIK